MLKQVGGENIVQKAVKGSESIRQSERHFYKFEQTPIWGAKSGLMSILLGYRYLPVSAGQI